MLEGQSFCVYTDHKPLTHAFNRSLDKYSPHEIRHLDYISQFTSDLRYIKGKENVVADTLSRGIIDAISTYIPSDAIDLDQIAAEQKVDDELQELRKSSSLKFREVPLHTSDNTITCDVSTNVTRPLCAK